MVLITNHGKKEEKKFNCMKHKFMTHIQPKFIFDGHWGGGALGHWLRKRGGAVNNLFL